MPVIAAPWGGVRPLATRRNGVLAAVLGIIGASSIAIMSVPQLAQAVDEGVHAGVKGAKSVAAILAERSPGQRPKGALASLKHKRIALHERGLPKLRHIIPPVAGLIETPIVPIIPPPVAPVPLYNVVAGGPPVPIPPVVGTPGGPGSPGGPPAFFPPPGGGGGGGGGVFIPPPIVTTAVPPPPATSAVPEPASWAMMLLGFGMIGAALRRKVRGGRQILAI